MTPNQLKAIPALLATPSVAAAARAAGLSRETLHRWLRDPAFRSRLDRTRAEAFAHTLRAVPRLFELATGALRRLLRDPDPRVRLKAVETALTLTFDADLALRAVTVQARQDWPDEPPTGDDHDPSQPDDPSPRPAPQDGAGPPVPAPERDAGPAVAPEWVR